MPNTDDWYKILQVHPTDEPEVIHTAYRRLVLKYHPDVNKSSHANEVMAALNRAYEVLGDSDKRAAYDRERGGQRRDTAEETQGRSRAWDESRRDDDFPNMPYGERISQLFRATRAGDTDKVRSLIFSGVNVNTREANKGWTPLHEVASVGHFQTAQFLVMSGNSVNIRDYRGYMPLHVAAKAGNFSIVQMLAAQGADINAKSMDGFTPLYVAAEADNLSIVQMLAAQGADITAKDKVGFTPLHVAARDGNTEVVRELIRLGADVNAMIGIKTPLSVALAGGHDSTVSVLRAAGAETWRQIYERLIRSPRSDFDI